MIKLFIIILFLFLNTQIFCQASEEIETAIYENKLDTNKEISLEFPKELLIHNYDNNKSSFKFKIIMPRKFDLFFTVCIFIFLGLYIIIIYFKR